MHSNAPIDPNHKDHAITWLEDYIPVSTRFDDPYFSRLDGRDETRHVFIEGNRLAEKAALGPSLKIAELGFGTGLNFLETWRWFVAEKAKGTIASTTSLAFTSFELYPLESHAIKTALDHWPQLASESAAFLTEWNRKRDNFNFQPSPDVSLSVHFGDANDILPPLDLAVSAWFLDGFSPAKNPQLWNGELMQIVHDKTDPGGSFATYTVAGWVRRNLENAGFKVEKLPGFANKRQMMAGTRPFT